MNERIVKLAKILGVTDIHFRGSVAYGASAVGSFWAPHQTGEDFPLIAIKRYDVESIPSDWDVSLDTKRSKVVFSGNGTKVRVGYAASMGFPDAAEIDYADVVPTTPWFLESMQWLNVAMQDCMRQWPDAYGFTFTEEGWCWVGAGDVSRAQYLGLHKNAVAHPVVLNVLSEGRDGSTVLAVTRSASFVEDYVSANEDKGEPEDWAFTAKIANVNVANERLEQIRSVIKTHWQEAQDRESVVVTFLSSFIQPISLAVKLGQPTQTLGLLPVVWSIAQDHITMTHKDIVRTHVQAEISENWDEADKIAFSASHIVDFRDDGTWYVPMHTARGTPMYFVPSGDEKRLGIIMPMVMPSWYTDELEE